MLSFATVYFLSRFHYFHGIYPISAINGQHGQHEILPSMLLQATRNPEHLSMSRESNYTKHSAVDGEAGKWVGGHSSRVLNRHHDRTLSLFGIQKNAVSFKVNQLGFLGPFHEG